MVVELQGQPLDTQLLSVSIIEQQLEVFFIWRIRELSWEICNSVCFGSGNGNWPKIFQFVDKVLLHYKRCGLLEQYVFSVVGAVVFFQKLSDVV